MVLDDPFVTPFATRAKEMECRVDLGNSPWNSVVEKTLQMCFVVFDQTFLIFLVFDQTFLNVSDIFFEAQLLGSCWFMLGPWLVRCQGMYGCLC